MTAAAGPVTIAHRGLSASHAENTMAAFEAALAHVNVLELDVRATSDAVLVCAHDATLERCWGDARRVGEVSWDDLHDIAPDVPRLADVLDAFGSRAGWFIDCKVSRPRAIAELERVVAEAGVSWESSRQLRAGLPMDQGTAAFESADAELLQSFSSRNSAGCVELVRGSSTIVQLIVGAPFITAYAQGVVLPERLASAPMLRMLRALRLGTYVYTVNDEQRFDELRDAGASGIFTDCCDAGW